MSLSRLAGDDDRLCGCLKFFGGDSTGNDGILHNSEDDILKTTHINGQPVNCIGTGTYGVVLSPPNSNVAWKVMKINQSPLRQSYKMSADAVRVLDREFFGTEGCKAAAIALAKSVSNLTNGPVCTLSFDDGRWSWDRVPSRLALAIVRLSEGTYRATPLEADLALHRLERVCETLTACEWPSGVLPVMVKWVVRTYESARLAERVMEMPVGQMSFFDFLQKTPRHRKQVTMENFAAVGCDVIQHFRRLDIRHVDMKQRNWVVFADDSHALKLIDLDAARQGDGPLTSCATYSPVDPEEFIVENDNNQTAEVQDFMMAWCFACAACLPVHQSPDFANDFGSLVALHGDLMNALTFNRDVVEPLVAGVEEFALAYWNE